MEPVRSTLGFGQINALVMVAVVLDALLPGRRRTKGLLIGLAAAVKRSPRPCSSCSSCSAMISRRQGG
jgi:alpha-1,2-mannosyltransferase